MNGYYQQPSGQIVWVGNASLNPQLTQGATFLGTELPPNFQQQNPGGAPSGVPSLPQGATGTNQVGTPGNWVINPTTGLNEFQPLNVGGSSQQGGQSNQGVQNAGGFNIATDPITSNPAYIQTQNQINALKMQMDAASLAFINSIETTYNALIEQQKRMNLGLEASLQQSLIQGGSQRYAQLSSAGIATTQMSFGLGQIAEWEGKKQQAIAQAKMDQEQNNFKILQFETENIEKFQAEKEAAMKELADKMIEEKKLTDQVARDNSIIEIYQQGKLDPASIFAELTKKGNKNVTLDDVKKAVKDLIPSGLNELALSAAQGGASPEAIKTILSSKDMNGAYQAALPFLGKDKTGIVGEYEYYKKDKASRGESYVDFDTYRTIDENRNAKIESAKSLGLVNSAQSSLINTISSSFENSPIVKDFITVQSKYQNMLANAGQGDGATDIAYIYDLMKVLDPTSVVRETEYATGASKSGNIFAGKLAYLNGLIDPEGGFISEQAKQNILGVIERRFATARDSYVNLRSEKIKTLEKRGILDAGEYLTEFDFQNRNQEIEQFQDKVAQWIANNPQGMSAYENLIRENPNLSEFDVAQILGIPL